MILDMNNTGTDLFPATSYIEYCPQTRGVGVGVGVGGRPRAHKMTNLTVLFLKGILQSA